MAAGELRIPKIERIRPKDPLGIEAAFAWQAFHDLSYDRKVGFGGALGVPWTAAQEYFDRAGMTDGEERAWTWELLKIMSGIEAEIQAASMRSDEPKPPPETATRRRRPSG